jgi:hypothetical protein
MTRKNWTLKCDADDMREKTFATEHIEPSHVVEEVVEAMLRQIHRENARRALSRCRVLDCK